jgi:hypothetical protein
MNQLKAFLLRWARFSAERFPLSGHALLILCYFGANAMAAWRATALAPALGKGPLSGLGTIALVFYHLRILDEIKDHEGDRLAHPERPLARGLISIPEALRVAAGIILVEIGLAAWNGLAAAAAVGLVICYSFLMFREFFVREWLRPRMILYGFTHSVISGLIAVAVFSFVTGRYPWHLPAVFGLLAAANWCLSNTFEFSRKTFAPEEEQEHVDSYSKRFGQLRAALLVFSMVFPAVLLAMSLGFVLHWKPYFFVLMGALLVIVMTVGSVFAFTKSTSWGRAFRTAGAGFLIAYNAVIILGAWTQ